MNSRCPLLSQLREDRICSLEMFKDLIAEVTNIHLNSHSKITFNYLQLSEAILAPPKVQPQVKIQIFQQWIYLVLADKKE